MTMPDGLATDCWNNFSDGEPLHSDGKRREPLHPDGKRREPLRTLRISLTPELYDIINKNPVSHTENFTEEMNDTPALHLSHKNYRLFRRIYCTSDGFGYKSSFCLKQLVTDGSGIHVKIIDNEDDILMHLNDALGVKLSWVLAFAHVNIARFTVHRKYYGAHNNIWIDFCEFVVCGKHYMYPECAIQVKSIDDVSDILKDYTFKDTIYAPGKYLICLNNFHNIDRPFNSMYMTLPEAIRDHIKIFLDNHSPCIYPHDDHPYMDIVPRHENVISPSGTVSGDLTASDDCDEFGPDF